MLNEGVVVLSEQSWVFLGVDDIHVLTALPMIDKGPSLNQLTLYSYVMSRKC